MENDSEEEETKETVETPKRRTQEEQQNYLRQIKESKEFEEFHSAFIDSVDNLKSLFNKVVMHNEEIDSKAILEDVENVVDKGRNGIHILDMLQCMRGYDDVT